MNAQNFDVMHIVVDNPENEVVFALAADLDNDLDEDVVIRCYYPEYYVFSYENLGEGVFGNEHIISSERIRDIYIKDIDNDNFADIIACDWWNLYWYKNRQDGTFELGQEMPGSPSGYNNPPSKVCSFDINGDGWNDIVSLWDAPNPGINEAQNLGYGVFGTLSGYYSGTKVAMHPVDLDDDGDIDLIVAEPAYGITLFENINGSIYNRSILNDQFDPNFLTSADMDQDGDMDIIASLQGAGIGWLENSGNLQFQSWRIISEYNVSGSRGLFVCDLDDDTDKYIICAFMSISRIAWFENNGSGTFGDLSTISTEILNPYSVYGADFDKDGDTDVLSVSYRDSLVVWFENDLNLNVNERDNGEYFSIYPNPSIGAIYIASEQDLNGKDVTIYNLAGQIIKKMNFVNNSVIVTDFENGLYFIGIETERGKIVEKFIVTE